jgi:hypothetical protein
MRNRAHAWLFAIFLATTAAADVIEFSQCREYHAESTINFDH